MMIVQTLKMMLHAPIKAIVLMMGLANVIHMRQEVVNLRVEIAQVSVFS